MVASESILDQIYEQTSNLERASNVSTIRQQLKEAVKELGRTERSVRSKTITFSLMKACKPSLAGADSTACSR